MARAPRWAGFGERLKQARENAGLTQEELAERLGLSEQSIYYWEAGQHFPRPKHLRELIALLRTPADWLLGEERRVGEDPAAYLAEEAELSFRAATGELSPEELQDVMDYIRFKRQQRRRDRREQGDEGGAGSSP